MDSKTSKVLSSITDKYNKLSTQIEELITDENDFCSLLGITLEQLHEKRKKYPGGIVFHVPLPDLEIILYVDHGVRINENFELERVN